MKPKTLSQKNGNGHHGETETVAELPTTGPDTLLKSVFESTPRISETEIENVEGFTLVSTADADGETYNRLATETESETEMLEEAGFENAPVESTPREAFFASYPELLPEARQLQEVIIGVDNRVRINNTTVYPWRAICALKITAADNTQWIGTGWLVSPRTVITAGHCVYMHAQGGWPKKIEVIPGLNDSYRPYNSYIGTSFRSVKGWTQNKNRDYDYGAIILPANARPGDRTGYFGYAVRNDDYLGAAVLNLSGYPGDKGGNQQWFMALKPKSLSSRVIYYDIDTMGGQSGAPVWIKIGDQRYCAGIHTNGHVSGNSATRIVQPVFDNIKAWKAQGL